MDDRIYWLKLMEDFFAAPKMKKLRKIPGGDVYTIIYLKLAILSLPTNGTLEYEYIEKSFEEELALKIDENVDAVSVTVKFMETVRLLTQVDEDLYLMNEIQDKIGSETKAAIRKRASRERQRLQGENRRCDIVTDMSQLGHTLVPNCLDTVWTQKETREQEKVTKKKERKEKNYQEIKGSKEPIYIGQREVEKEELIFPEDSFQVQTARRLIAACLKEIPNRDDMPITKKGIDAWAVPIHQLLRNNYTEEQITRAMDYALNNEFWKPHMQSTAKFKDKFTTLLEKANFEEQRQGAEHAPKGKMAVIRNHNNFERRTYDMNALENQLLKVNLPPKE